MIGIAVFTVYIHNTTQKEVKLKGVVSTTTTQSETKKDPKDDSDDTKDKDNSSTPAVTTAPADEPEVTTTAPQFPMDINYATKEALLCVPNIGEKTAESILSFIHEKGIISDMDMLLEINGIGEAKLNDLKRYFYVSDEYTVTTSNAVSSPEQTTTVSKTTTPKETKPPKTTTPKTTTPAPVRKKVNINTADADELMKCLLINRTQANEIVALREEIGGYTNILEILYCESISDSLYIEIDDYLEI